MFYSGNVVVAGLLVVLVIVGLVCGLVGGAWLLEIRTRRAEIGEISRQLAGSEISLIDEITEWLDRQ